MELPPFPCVPVHLDETEHPGGVIAAFLKERPSSRWVLLGTHAVQTHMQLWTAWVKTTRNELRGSCVARSIDAEFMRYLAGTHHVSEAFARAGYQEGSGDAWILHLPQAESSRNSLGHIQRKRSSKRLIFPSTMQVQAQINIDIRFLMIFVILGPMVCLQTIVMLKNLKGKAWTAVSRGWKSIAFKSSKLVPVRGLIVNTRKIQFPPLNMISKRIGFCQSIC